MFADLSLSQSLISISLSKPSNWRYGLGREIRIEFLDVMNSHFSYFKNNFLHQRIRQLINVLLFGWPHPWNLPRNSVNRWKYCIRCGFHWRLISSSDIFFALKLRVFVVNVFSVKFLNHKTIIYGYMNERCLPYYPSLQLLIIAWLEWLESFLSSYIKTSDLYEMHCNSCFDDKTKA